MQQEVHSMVSRPKRWHEQFGFGFLALVWLSSCFGIEPAADDEGLAAIRAAAPSDRLPLIDAQFAKSPSAAARAGLHRLRAEALRDLGRLEDAVREADLLVELTETVGDPVESARASMLRGTLEAEAGNIAAALERFHAAARLFEVQGAEADQARALNAIGVAHNFVHDYQRARRYYEQALELARRTRADKLELTLLGNLALVSSALDEAEAGLERYREALASAERLEDRHTLALTHANLCQRLLTLDRPDEAGGHCREAVERLENLALARPLAGVRMALGQAALAAGRHAEAIDYFERSLELASGTVPSVELDLYRLLSEAHAESGDHPQALDWLRQHVEFDAELSKRERQAIVEELDTRYRVEQIEREVEVLRLDGALKQATLRQRNLLLMLLGAGLLLSAVAAFLGWRGYRIERRLELALTARNRELEIALARIEELARTDPLTGLMNRRAFEEQAIREIAKARRNGTELVLAMADIDHFKALNDAFGHAAGDEVLRQLAARLRSGLRESDLVCRWGGEEFVCLLVDASVGAAFGALERLRSNLDRQPIIVAPGAPQVRLTFGLTPLEIDLDEALAAADAALYEGKRAGRDRVMKATSAGSSIPDES